MWAGSRTGLCGSSRLSWSVSSRLAISNVGFSRLRSLTRVDWRWCRASSIGRGGRGRCASTAPTATAGRGRATSHHMSRENLNQVLEELWWRRGPREWSGRWKSSLKNHNNNSWVWWKTHKGFDLFKSENELSFRTFIRIKCSEYTAYALNEKGWDNFVLNVTRLQRQSQRWIFLTAIHQLLK